MARALLLLGLCLSLVTGCTSKPAPEPTEHTPASIPPAKPSPEQLRERDLLFAAHLARAPQEGVSKRVRTLSLAEAVVRTRSSDAARALAPLLPERVRYRVEGERNALSGNGRYAASFELDRKPESTCINSSPAAVEIHDLATGKVIAGPWKTPHMDQAALSDDAKLLAVTDRERVTVLDATSGEARFSVTHSPCLEDPMEPADGLAMAWHPSGEALLVYRRWGGELVVWSRAGEELLREPMDSARSEALETDEARAELWTRLGLETTAETSELRFETRDGTFEVRDADGERKGAFASATHARVAHTLDGHLELAVLQQFEQITVLDWTDAGMFEAVCASVEAGLTQAEWAEQLPDWPWVSRCDAPAAPEPSAPEPEPIEAELSAHWRALFELAVEHDPLREEHALLVRAHALRHLDSPGLRASVAKIVAARPEVSVIPSAGSVDAILPNPDDDRIALFLSDGRVELRDASTGEGEVIDTLAADESAADVRWAGGELVYLLWRAEEGRSVAILRTLGDAGQTRRVDLGPAKRAPELGLSPDGAYLVAVTGTRKGKLEIWELASGTRIYSAPARAKRRCVCCCGERCACPEIVHPRVDFSPDSRYLAVDLFQELAIVDLSAAKLTTRVDLGNPDGVDQIVFGADNQHLFIYQIWRFGGEDVHVHALASGERLDWLVNPRPWQPEEGWRGAQLLESDEADSPFAVLVADGKLVLTAARIEGEQLHVEDPRYAPGMLVPIESKGVARLTQARTLEQLPALAPGHTPIITGDRRTLLSVDNASGRALRWTQPKRDADTLVDDLDALRAAVCASVASDLSPAQWREFVGDVPFTPLCAAQPAQATN